MPYLTDQSSQEDLLERSVYIDHLVEMIETCDTPYNIGIFGSWGSGKSNLLTFIKNKLGNRNIKFIEFSAWKYAQDQESLRRKLLIETRTQLKEKDPQKNIYDANTFPYINISRAITVLPNYLVVALFWFIALSLAILVPLGIFTFLKKLDINWLWNIYKTILIFPLFGALIPLLNSVITSIQVKPQKIETSELFESSFKDSIRNALIPWYLKLLSKVPSIKSKIKNTVDKNIKNKKIVILIDDLDRCQSYKVIEVLDALMTFFQVNNCVYLVAADAQIIERAVVQQQKADSGKEKDYLDKIFQFTFPIPPLTQPTIELYTKEQFKKLDVQNVDIDELTEMIVKGLMDWNPRKIKLILNSFRFLLLSTKEQLIKNNENLLFKTIILQKDYNSFFSLLSGNWEKLRAVEEWLQAENAHPISNYDQYTQNLIQQVQSNTKLKNFLKTPPFWGQLQVMPFFTLTGKAGYMEIVIPNKESFSQYALNADFGALRQVIESSSNTNETLGFLKELLTMYQVSQDQQKTNVARAFIYSVDLEQGQREKKSLIDEYINYITYGGLDTLPQIPANELVTLLKEYPATNRWSLFIKIMDGMKKFTDSTFFVNVYNALINAKDIFNKELLIAVLNNLIAYLTAKDGSFKELPFTYIPQFVSIIELEKTQQEEIFRKFLTIMSATEVEKEKLLNLIWQIKDSWNLVDKILKDKFKQELEKLSKSGDPSIQSVSSSILSQWT